MNNKSLLPVLLIIALIGGFISGSYYTQYKSPNLLLQHLVHNDAGQPGNVDTSLMWQVWGLLHERFIDKSKLDDQKLLYGAIQGMVDKAGDPYTAFFPPTDTQNFKQQISGAFGGVGIEIGQRSNILTVIAPIKDSPAAKAGIMAGDKIVKIGDKSTQDMKVDEAVSLIRGPKGTPITLSYLRGDASTPKEVSLTRDTIKIPAVAWKMLDNNVAHLQIMIFSENVDSEFQQAVKEITASKAQKIVLDVRNNPGGLLDSAVNIAGYFIDPGQIVTIEKFADGTQNEYKTQGNPVLKKYPLVVLMNKGSASASEILSGALRDDRGITLIGDQSFGKGSVQEVVDLPGKTSLKVTIAKWFTPKNYSIHNNGLKPDIAVELKAEDITANKDPQLDKAQTIIKNLQ